MTREKSTDMRTKNKLIGQKSPYLLQHAHNPVDWYPWGEEAFKKAKEEDKPIFLSIGYSTCHWCHVMEKESFEDKKVAKLLNDTCIAIKVDREERPDIDNIYMSVCQALTGRGGWPLTILMTPEKMPFYAATYIPRESRYGAPGMLDLVPAIKEMWINKREELVNSAEAISAAVYTHNEQEGIDINQELLHRTFQQLHGNFDQENAGFGRAPKFPTPHHLTFLLRYWKRTGNADALEMVERTLKAMRMGGVYDHIGFGFHRYSTDRNWLVPHFEKMLYDQALMVTALAETYQVTGETEYMNTAGEVLSYLKRDMLSPEGAFFSAEDADSEGEEGRFYLWTSAEIDEVLGNDDASSFKDVFNIRTKGNFAQEHTKEFTGNNIPHMTVGLAKNSLKEYDRAQDDNIPSNLENARTDLFNAREKRIHPSKDDKILTDWNGLTIVALCKAAQAFGYDEYIQMAENTARFFLENMTDKEGKMKHRYREGEAAIDAFLEDYAFFIWGLIELYQTNLKTEYLERALKINSYLIAHFYDSGHGGFFHTSDEGEELIFRSKEIYDGAIPSGNSVCIMNLLKLARITGYSELEDMAHMTIKAFSVKVSAAPIGYTQFMSAADLAINGSLEIVVVGDPEKTDTKDIAGFINNRFIPEKVLVFKPQSQQGIIGTNAITNIAPYAKDMEMIDGRTTVHICRNNICKLPSNDMEEVRKQIENISRA
ncbi:MAG: thioredoxin domain-containing protein [Methanolobus sp.]|nr:thioredoxin domain-containing protein [Methanolobus sp.]